MRNLTLFSGKMKSEYCRPFTVVDSQGDHWAVALDEVWLFAVKGLNKGPRFKGNAKALAVILQLLRVPSSNPMQFEQRSLKDLNGLGSILGVAVDLKRFGLLVSELPEVSITIWNATESLGSPGLMLTCSDCLAILMGYTGNIEHIPRYNLVPILGDPLDAFILD